jgi:hypothetical protein
MDRRMMWGGTVHLMRKMIFHWKSYCETEELTRVPLYFRKGYLGATPVNCLDCIAASSNADNSDE